MNIKIFLFLSFFNFFLKPNIFEDLYEKAVSQVSSTVAGKVRNLGDYIGGTEGKYFFDKKKVNKYFDKNITSEVKENLLGIFDVFVTYYYRININKKNDKITELETKNIYNYILNNFSTFLENKRLLNEAVMEKVASLKNLISEIGHKKKFYYTLLAYPVGEKKYRYFSELYLFKGTSEKILELYKALYNLLMNSIFNISFFDPLRDKNFLSDDKFGVIDSIIKQLNIEIKDSINVLNEKLAHFKIDNVVSSLLKDVDNVQIEKKLISLNESIKNVREIDDSQRESVISKIIILIDEIVQEAKNYEKKHKNNDFFEKLSYLKHFFSKFLSNQKNEVYFLLLFEKYKVKSLKELYLNIITFSKDFKVEENKEKQLDEQKEGDLKKGFSIKKSIVSGINKIKSYARQYRMDDKDTMIYALIAIIKINTRELINHVQQLQNIYSNIATFITYSMMLNQCNPDTEEGDFIVDRLIKKFYSTNKNIDNKEVLTSDINRSFLQKIFDFNNQLLDKLANSKISLFQKLNIIKERVKSSLSYYTQTTKGGKHNNISPTFNKKEFLEDGMSTDITSSDAMSKDTMSTDVTSSDSNSDNEKKRKKRKKKKRN